MAISTGCSVSSLYVHVPFCARKCEYCAFYSEVSEGALVGRYVSALTRELELVAQELSPRTVFFGGGTPSLLNLEHWRCLLGTMERCGLLGASEWTIECNPATVSLEKALLWRSYGVNRVSLGVQSLDDTLLDRLGRVHSRQMVFKSFDILRRAGFANVNLDLMFAIPGQTLSLWRETLRQALDLGSEHLSAYEVIYEEDTPLFEQLQAGRFSVDEELACAMYEELLECASASGLHQYEVANFARVANADALDCGDKSLRFLHRGSRDDVQHLVSVGDASTCSQSGVVPPHATTTLPGIPRYACQHNLNYWHGGAYHGLGPSAAGYVGGTRTKNWANTRLYCEALEGGRRAIEWRETLPPLQRAGETAAFGLRLNSGWRFDQFQQVTGFDLRAEWESEMSQLVDRTWAHLDAEGFRLTSLGLRFADAAAELFLR